MHFWKAYCQRHCHVVTVNAFVDAILILQRWGHIVCTVWLVGFGFVLENILEYDWILAVGPHCGSDAVKCGLGRHCMLIRWPGRPTNVHIWRLVLGAPSFPIGFSDLWGLWGGVWTMAGRSAKRPLVHHFGLLHLTLCLIPVLAVLSSLCYHL